MKKLLAVLVLSALAGFGLGCSGSTTTKAGGAPTINYGGAGSGGDTRSAPPMTTPAPISTKSAGNGAGTAKDMSVKIAAKPGELKAKGKGDLEISVTRGADNKGEIKLSLSSSNKDELKVADTATIAAGDNTVKVPVESLKDMAGEYKVKITTSDGKADAEGMVKVTK